MKNSKINTHKEYNPEIRQKLCDEILEISNKIAFLKQEVVSIERIENQSQKIKDNIKEIEEQENEKGKRKGDIEK